MVVVIMLCHEAFLPFRKRPERWTRASCRFALASALREFWEHRQRAKGSRDFGAALVLAPDPRDAATFESESSAGSAVTG